MMKQENQTTSQVNKYITEISKLKHLQCYMTKFEIHDGKFELKLQIQQLYNTYKFTI